MGIEGAVEVIDGKEPTGTKSGRVRPNSVWIGRGLTKSVVITA